MKKSAIAILQIGFWLCYLIMIMVILGVLYGDESLEAEAQIQHTFETLIFFALVPSALSFYGFYYFLFPKYFKQKKYLLSAFYGVLIPVVSALIGYFSLTELYGEDTCGEDPVETFIGMILFMSVISLISGIIGLVIQGFITWFEEAKLREKLVEKNHQMELALVKSQLDPHFLFNTINNIDVLILKDPNEASNYLNNLSDIMRFMLFETKSELIPLAKEVEYIKKYIELQKIRTSNSNYVNFEVSGVLEGKKIAPMVFVPFIENAFKHTNNKKIENAIDVRVVVNDASIELHCINKFEPNKATQQESHGLGNMLIKKRLNLLYPNQYNLTIKKDSNQYRVLLIINHG